MIAQRFYCFVHIEKCAGSTFHRILSANFRRYLVLQHRAKFGFRLTPRQLGILRSITRCTAIGGHCVHPYVDYAGAIGSEVSYISFLRAPVERYLSHFNHIVESKGLDWTFDDFLEMSQYHNFQTKRIGGANSFASAKAIIEQEDFFLGFVDRYRESLALLSEWYRQRSGKELDLRYRSLNRASDRSASVHSVSMSSLNESQLNACRMNNEEDLKLYEFVSQKFKHAMESSENMSEILSTQFGGDSYEESLSRRVATRINSLVSKLIQPLAVRLSGDKVHWS